MPPVIILNALFGTDSRILGSYLYACMSTENPKIPYIIKYA